MTTPVPVDVGDHASAPRPAPAMGWHPDPFRRHQVRFHDGAQWTEHVADGGFASLDTEPVAHQPWSRPHPATDAPPADGPGPRVLAEPDGASQGLDARLLLLAVDPGAGERRVRDVDDRDLGALVVPRRSWPRRALAALAVSRPTAVTRLELRPPEGPAHLVLERPARRSAPTVDISGPGGRLGSVTATHVRQGLEAGVVAADGTEVGRLVRTGVGEPVPVAVVGPDGAPHARLTPVWDVPGSRQHLPPGVVLVDRRSPDGADVPAEHRTLLLGALLAPELLLQPAASPA